MCARGDARERWTTARHEAGHAVAAFHYETTIEFVSIKPGVGSLGTTKLAMSKGDDAVALFSGPLSEKPWNEFCPMSRQSIPKLCGTDHEALRYLQLELQLSQEQCLDYEEDAVEEAERFLSNLEVQAQVDRLAKALLERCTIAAAEAKKIAGFRHSLRPELIDDTR